LSLLSSFLLGSFFGSSDSRDDVWKWIVKDPDCFDFWRAGN
jgi:hypothetical protein